MYSIPQNLSQFAAIVDFFSITQSNGNTNNMLHLNDIWSLMCREKKFHDGNMKWDFAPNLQQLDRFLRSNVQIMNMINYKEWEFLRVVTRSLPFKISSCHLICDIIPLPARYSFSLHFGFLLPFFSHSNHHHGCCHCNTDIAKEIESWMKFMYEYITRKMLRAAVYLCC